MHPGGEGGPREFPCLESRAGMETAQTKMKKESFKGKKGNGEVITGARRGGNSGKSLYRCHVLQRRRIKNGERKISH